MQSSVAHGTESGNCVNATVTHLKRYEFVSGWRTKTYKGAKAF
jgi:hypothetical protein